MPRSPNEQLLFECAAFILRSGTHEQSCPCVRRHTVAFMENGYVAPVGQNPRGAPWWGPGDTEDCTCGFETLLAKLNEALKQQVKNG